MEKTFDAVVIGSGPGGYAAAIRIVRRGASAAIVEKDLFGGTCLNRGCVPSKTLLSSGHALLSVKNAAMLGIDVALASPNWKKIQARKNAIVGGFRRGLKGLIDANKIAVFEGLGTISGPGRVQVAGKDTADLGAGSIILATGSQPVELGGLPFDGETVLSSTEALELPEIPKSMLIIGGGVIGCEMACLYASMGAKITIIEAMGHLLPTEDEWVGRLLAREFKKLDIDLMTGRKVDSLDESGTSPAAVLDDGLKISAEKILVAVGRKPNLEDTTIQALSLDMNGPAVAVDQRMQTSAEGIYAIGDVVGTTYLAHGAFAEAEVAAVNASGGDEKMGDYNRIPRAVYCFPEVASVGMNEKTCRQKGIDFSVGRSAFMANSRSAAEGQTCGEIRTVRDNASGRIVGITIVGSTATEHIATARVLLGSRENIAGLAFPHPTVSEVLKEAWEDAFGQSIHNPPR